MLAFHMRRLSPFGYRPSASNLTGKGGSLRMFALQSGAGSVNDGGPRRFDYKKRVLTTTEGGLVRKVRVFQQVSRGGGEGEGDSKPLVGASPLATPGSTPSKAQQRKMEKKELRLKRQADNQGDPTRKERGREVSAKLVQCLKNRDFDTAVALYREHRDVFTYKHNFVALLNVCYKYEHLETAREIFDVMKAEHGPPVEQAYLALIRCHTAKDTPARLVHDNIELARGHVETMALESIEARLRTYQPILAAVCRLGDLPKALAITKEMMGRGIFPRAEQLGMLLTCAVHGQSLKQDATATATATADGGMASRQRLLAELLGVVGRIGEDVVGVPMSTLHSIDAALRGESVEESYARGVLVQSEEDIPGEIIVNGLSSGGGGAGVGGSGSGRDGTAVAMAMNVFSDQPLACYYDNGQTNSLGVSGSTGTGTGTPSIRGSARGPPPGMAGMAGTIQYEYMTIRQRVAELVARVAGEEASKAQQALALQAGRREALAQQVRQWNAENSKKGDSYSSGGGTGGGGGAAAVGGEKKGGNEGAGKGGKQRGRGPDLYPSGPMSMGELPDIPLYKELFYTAGAGAGADAGAGGDSTSVDKAPCCLVEINKATNTCPFSGTELTRVTLTEQQKENVRAALFSIANSTSKHQGNAIKTFGAWLDAKAEAGTRFTYIVDGANVAYHRQNFEGGKFNFRQVELVVDGLRARMKRADGSEGEGEGAPLEAGEILVLLPYPYAQKVVPNSSRHRKGRKIEYLSPSELAILERFERENMLYVVPQGGNDDWFWMYATVHRLRTAQAYCITNDLMRDHRDAFAGESANVFERWRAGTVMHFDFSRAVEESYQWPELMLTQPGAFSREVHISAPVAAAAAAAGAGSAAGEGGGIRNADYNELDCLEAVSDALDTPPGVDGAIIECEFTDDASPAFPAPVPAPVPVPSRSGVVGSAEGGGDVFIHLPASDRTSLLSVRLGLGGTAGASGGGEGTTAATTAGGGGGGGGDGRGMEEGQSLLRKGIALFE